MIDKPIKFYTDYYYSMEGVPEINERCACGNLKHRCTCKKVDAAQAQNIAEQVISPQKISASFTDCDGDRPAYDTDSLTCVQNGKILRDNGDLLPESLCVPDVGIACMGCAAMFGVYSLDNMGLCLSCRFKKAEKT